jgi:hypothetical protein
VKNLFTGFVTLNDQAQEAEALPEKTKFSGHAQRRAPFLRY